MEQIVSLMPLILLIFIMYFLLIRPQKKKEKAVTAMRNAVKVGDEVVTIGGIIGKIVKTRDDILTIQVGTDKTKFEVMRWAISQVAADGPASSSKKTRREESEEEPQTEAQKKALPKKFKKPEAAPDRETPAEVPADTETVAEPETETKE